MNEKWNAGQSMEAGFWSVISESGRVIALRVTDEKYARQICAAHNAETDAGEMDKRRVLEWVFSALAGVIDSWNGLGVEENERGRDNDFLCIVLAEDGSGQVGTVHEIPTMNPQDGVFGEVSDWADFFDKWIDEGEWIGAMPDD